VRGLTPGTVWLPRYLCADMDRGAGPSVRRYGVDSALELAPGLSASLYLRGIVRLEKGDKAGRTDVQRALRMAPELAARYAMHGVVPKD